jgi:hypothetical protein
MRQAIVLLGMALLTYSTNACVAREQHSDTTQSGALNGLVVSMDAKNIRRSSEYDGAVYYSVEKDYPAKEVIDEISVKMLSAAWTPISEEVTTGDVDPTARTWWTYVDQAGITVHQWNGTWTNANGDLIAYILKYRESADRIIVGVADVTGLRMTAGTVRRIRESLKKQAG